MTRWLMLLLLALPFPVFASCSGVPGCDDRADLAVGSALDAVCVKASSTDTKFTGSLESICPTMKISGFYTCYLDAEKKRIWTEVTCVDGKPVGLSALYVANRWLWIFRQINDEQRERIADVALPAPEETKAQ